MQLKKVIITGTAAALLAGSLLNVSAAELPSGNYAKALKKNADLIINVEAYKAAYSDLAEAFGDDDDAYIEHYLTTGVYEGRTEGVLFDPLAYAEAYSDVKDAFGDDILAIANHYVTFGVAEKRTMGTANGYEDIAEAEKNGASGIVVQRRNNNISSYSTSNSNGYNNNATAVTAGTGNSSSPVIAAGGGSAVTTPDSSKNYYHTTSIYTDDRSALLRVEYYDNNNKLVEYSDVTNYDKSTNSYTETVYKYDKNTQTEVAVRTDTYVNGQLTSSQNH